MMEVAKAMGLDGRRCCLLNIFLKRSIDQDTVPMKRMDTDPGLKNDQEEDMAREDEI